MNSPVALAPLHVLVADGSPMIAERLNRMLQTLPGLATSAPVWNAVTLRERLETSSFDVLILDMFLPGGAAPELLSQLPLSRTCTVIVLGPADCEPLFRHERTGTSIHFFHKCREIPRALDLLRQLSGSTQATSGVNR